MLVVAAVCLIECAGMKQLSGKGGRLYLKTGSQIDLCRTFVSQGIWPELDRVLRAAFILSSLLKNFHNIRHPIADHQLFVDESDMGVDFRGGLERITYLVVGLPFQRMLCLAHAKPKKFLQYWAY